MDDLRKRITDTLNVILSFISKNAAYIIGAPIAIYFVYFAVSTLSWRMDLDSPIMIYISYLISERGFIPYQDIFDMNLPGSYLVYSLIGGLSSYTDFGFRIADLIFLGIITISTYFIMRPIGKNTAWVGSALFGILYFGGGPQMSLEREVIVIALVSLAVMSTVAFPRANRVMKSVVLGLLLGAAALVKPTALIALPVLLLYAIFETGKPKKDEISKCVYIISGCIVGLLIPAFAAILYLWFNGAIQRFIEIAINYWPLYGDFSGFHQEFTGFQELKYTLLNLRHMGDFGVWVIVAIINGFCCFALFKPADETKKIVILLIALAVSFYLYPALSGQFYGYHWLPFLYFVVLLCSLAFVKPPKELHISLKLLPVIVLVLACVISFKLPGGAFRNIYGDYDVVAPRGGIPDEIAEYLDEHLKPGDRVQPLDWAWGGIHGVLLARGELATSFIYDFHFYHHVDDPYIIALRKQFLSELDEGRPRFIVEIPYEAHPRNTTPGRERGFPELEEFIGNNYEIVDMKEGDGYIIYEKISP